MDYAFVRIFRNYGYSIDFNVKCVCVRFNFLAALKKERQEAKKILLRKGSMSFSLT